ncbi:YslB family protein [Lactobacillus agrestimuris]|uniref:YslB family protein n=1 Tax=Lactobacillus agrestimuris TaxID=2941328 RepID=UPI002042F902|nr:YslB family protein [Lactobacillus agrestimuris]
MHDNNQSNEHVYFLNQLYRDFLLPEILGDDNDAILYWAGKRITRHYALASYDDLIEFFEEAEFGTLELIKEKRTSITFELSGQTVIDRLNSDSKEFSIESGMIAEVVQKETGRNAESEINILDKDQKVQIIARFG